MQLLPERRQVGGRDPLVKGLAFGGSHGYAAIERGRSPSVKPSLARSAISAEDCAWSSGTSGGANRGPVRVVVEMRNDAFQRRDHRIGLQRLAQSRDLGLQGVGLRPAPVFINLADSRDVDIPRGGDAARATPAQRVEQKDLGAREYCEARKAVEQRRVLLQSPELSFSPTTVSG